MMVNEESRAFAYGVTELCIVKK